MPPIAQRITENEDEYSDQITSMISNSDKLKRWISHDGDNVITEWVTLRADDFDALVKELQAWKVHTGDWFDLEEWLLARHSKP